MGKSRNRKSGTKKKRSAKFKPRKHQDAVPEAEMIAAPSNDEPITGSKGMMTGMVGGFRRAVGAEQPEPESRSWIDGFLLWAFLAVVLGVVAWRVWG